MKKWLANLFKFKRAEQPLEEEIHDFSGYTMIDEQTGLLLSVVMVCGCGNPVSRFQDKEKDFFYCCHCDRPCYEEKPCEMCEQHYMFDAEAVKAEFNSGFEFGEEEDK